MKFCMANNSHLFTSRDLSAPPCRRIINKVAAIDSLEREAFVARRCNLSCSFYMKIPLVMPVLGCMLIFLFILSGCGVARSKEPYLCYFGVKPDETELATLDLGYATQVIIDDMYLVQSYKYSTVKLISGMHKVNWITEFRIAYAVNPSGHDFSREIADINFKAGHRYIILQDRTTGYGYKLYTWIEDTTNGNVVYGEKMP